MSKSYSLSLIFPTLNERKNLEILVPQFYKLLEELYKDFEIIIVDDNSTDGTDKYINHLQNTLSKVIYIKRDEKKSLPLSIFKGINEAKFNNVAWLDADGSMHIDAFSKLAQTHIENPSSVIIGSRFAEGGGYKGIQDVENTSLLKSLFNVQKSQDSVFGMVLSNLFNKFLSLFYKSDIKDITSGFIITPKKYIKKSAFMNCVYGEYFIYLVANFLEQNIKIIEVGYICETRLNGVSKTAPNLIVLVKRGLPYVAAAIRCRRKFAKNY